MGAPAGHERAHCEADGVVALSADRFRHIEFSGPSTPWRPKRSAPTQATERAAELFEPADQAFCAWLLRQGGVDQSRYRPRPLRRRLAACYRALRVGSAGEARTRLQREPALIPAAISTVVIGVTSFFRDRGIFEAIHRDILPRLLKLRPAISIWSAGCSTGAELYSVAILLGELSSLHRAAMTGTDCRAPAVASARRGEFDFPAVEAVDPAWRERYFDPLPARNGLRVSQPLRNACRWQTADVFACMEGPAWDVILCRNMAIYLQPDASAELWRRLVGALRPGGYLVVGKAERPCRHLPLRRISDCIYHREEER